MLLTIDLVLVLFIPELGSTVAMETSGSIDVKESIAVESSPVGFTDTVKYGVECISSIEDIVSKDAERVIDGKLLVAKEACVEKEGLVKLGDKPVLNELA